MTGIRHRTFARCLVLALSSGFCSYAAAAAEGLPGPSAHVASAPEQVALANRQSAVQSAKQMLADVVMPAGTAAVSGEPPGSGGALALPGSQFWVAAQVDRAAFWVSSASPRAVMMSIAEHLPASASREVSGFAGSLFFATYRFPVVHPSSLGPRQLAVEATPLNDGRTGVRADAQVEYLAPRPSNVAVPRQARELTVTMTRGSRILLARETTQRAKIRSIAEAVDALPFAGYLFPEATRCPGTSGSAPTVDTFTFRARPSGRVLARVRELAETPTFETTCGPTALLVVGSHRKHLQDGGRLLRSAGRILGVTLTARG